MFATLNIPESSFVCEYKGVLMSAKEGREKKNNTIQRVRETSCTFLNGKATNIG